MLELVNINNLLNFISVIVVLISNIVLIYNNDDYNDIIGFIYIFLNLPIMIYMNINKELIVNKISIKNPYYYVYSFMTFNMGIFMICINDLLLGSGLFLVIIGMFNFLMAIFHEPKNEFGSLEETESISR